MSQALGRARLAAFAAPQAPLAGVIIPVFVFVSPFYAETLGLGLTLTGVILGLAKLFDVATDPLLGLVSDGRPTRWGRRRPWIVIGAPILIVSAWMVFAPPEGAGAWWLGGWMFALYVGWTLVALSHNAWALELSPDYDERSRITGWLQGGFVGGMLVALAIPTALEALMAVDRVGQMRGLALFVALGLPLALIFAFRAVGERAAAPAQGVDMGALGEILRRSAGLRRLLIAYFAISLASALVGSLFLFVASHGLKLGEGANILLFILFAAGFASVPLWVRLAKATSKHGALIAATLYGAALPMTLLALPEGRFALAAIVFAAIGVNYAAGEFLPRAMAADLVDEERLASGRDRAGLVFALLQTVGKGAAGLAVALGYPLLALTGFDPRVENSPEALQALMWVVVFGPLIAYGVALAALWRYPLTRAAQARMRAALGRP